MALSAQEKQLWQQLAQADAAGDTETATRIAAQIEQARAAPTQKPPARQPAQGGAEQPNMAPPSAAGAFQGALMDNLTFGLVPAAIDAVGGQITNALTGGRVPAEQAQQNAQQARNQQFQEHPWATAAGTVAGIGGNVAALSAALPAGMAMKAGKPLGNALKAAGWGGGTAGVSTLAHGGSPSDALVATGAGAIAGPVVGKGVEMAASRLAPAASRAWKLVADKLGVSADDLGGYIRRYKSLTNENPSVSQLLSAEQAGAIREFAAQNPKMAAAMQTARRAQEQGLPTQVSSAVRKVATPEAPSLLRGIDLMKATPDSLETTLRNNMTTAMRSFENDSVGISTDLLTDPMVWKAMPRAMRHDLAGTVADAVESKASTVPLTVRQAETIRYRLRRLDSSDANRGEGYGDLAEELASEAGKGSDKYAAALKDFAEAAKFNQGFSTTFSSPYSGSTSANVQDALQTAAGQNGQKAGTLAYTANRAAKDPASAAQVADEISSNTSKATDFANATTPYGAQRAKESAGAVIQGERSAASATPSSVNSGVSSLNAGESAAVGAGEIAVGLPFSGLHKIINSLTTLLKSQRFPDKVQQEIAQALTSNDEKVVAATLAKLSKATGDVNAVKRLATVIAAETGLKLGQILGPDEPATAR